MTKMDILNKLDNSLKHVIVTDEELLQRGVIYDSRGRIEEAQRRIFEDHLYTEKTGLFSELENKISISRGTSLVEESRIQNAKSINIIVKNISLKDKKNNQIIVPVAYNLVKTIFGVKGFEQWMKDAINDDRLLYINKKKTEPILAGGLELPPKLYQHIQHRSIRLPDGFPHSHTASPTTDVFGFLSNNITRYKETVKKIFPERFPSSEEKILKQTQGVKNNLCHQKT